MTTEKNSEPFRPKPKFTTQVRHVDYDTGEVITKEEASKSKYYKLKSVNHGIKWNIDKTEGTIIRTTFHRKKQYVQNEIWYGR